jgi:hypothetical protein
MNELTAATDVTVRQYPIAFTVDSASAQDIVGNSVTQSDPRCDLTQTLQVLTTDSAGNLAWVEYGDTTEQLVPYIRGF